MKKKKIATIVVVILLLGFSSLPHITLLPVYKEGVRLVPLLEDYKNQHGTYPDNLNQLGIEIKYDEKTGVVFGIKYMRKVVSLV